MTSDADAGIERPLVSSRYRQRKSLFHALLLAMLLVTVLVVVDTRSALASTGGWNIVCGFKGALGTDPAAFHYNRDDPIVDPGVRGATHMHVFAGNSSTNYTTTIDSLDSTATLAGCGWSSSAGRYDEENKSAYWQPRLLNARSRWAPIRLVQAYYKSGLDVPPSTHYSPYPHSMRMVVGASRVPSDGPGGLQPTNRIAWSCHADAQGIGPVFAVKDTSVSTIADGSIFVPQGSEPPLLHQPYDCSDFVYGAAQKPSHIVLMVTFPTCWAGDATHLQDNAWATQYVEGSSVVMPGSPGGATEGNILADYADTDGRCPGMSPAIPASAEYDGSGCATVGVDPSAMYGSPTGRWCLLPRLRLTFVYGLTDGTGAYLSADCVRSQLGDACGTTWADRTHIPLPPDRALSGHADYFSAWSLSFPDGQGNLVDSLANGVAVCINQARSCGTIDATQTLVSKTWELRSIAGTHRASSG